MQFVSPLSTEMLNWWWWVANCWIYCWWRYHTAKLRSLSCTNCLQSTSTSLLSESLPLMPWSIDAQGSPQSSDGYLQSSGSIQQNCWWLCGLFLDILLPHSFIARQDAAQGFYWNNSQAAIDPFVAPRAYEWQSHGFAAHKLLVAQYQDSDGLCHLSYIVTSDSNHLDAIAVHLF